MSEVVVLSAEQVRELVLETWKQAQEAARGPEVLKRKQVAELLQVDEKTVRKYVDQDGLPAHRMGHELRFFRSQVLAWLDARDPEKVA